MKALAEQVEHAEANPLPLPGAVGRGRKRADDVSPIKHGNQADYLARRLARDRPDILARAETRSLLRRGRPDPAVSPRARGDECDLLHMMYSRRGKPPRARRRGNHGD